MTYNEFKLCKGCPVKGARYFDPDGYWCCCHPEAWKHAQTMEEAGCERRECDKTPSGYVSGDEIPFVCMKSCPCDHWKTTIEGGQIPKGQVELVTDAERMA